MAINMTVLYRLLREAARRQEIISYEDLSRRYHDATKEWYEPHGTWDEPLGLLNRLTHATGFPPLSAVVTYKRADEEADWSPPGAGFWGSSPGVPAQPPTAKERLRVWYELLGRVHQTPWPEALPARKLGRYIVADPKICHGKLTFVGTRIFVQDVLDMVAEGRDWDTIIKEWDGSITREAIAEAVQLAGRALLEHADEYAKEAASA